jgi:RHS repeat-associated protein
VYWLPSGAVQRQTSVTTRFVYDEAGQLLGQYDNAGQPIQQYLWLEGQPVGVLLPQQEGQPFNQRLKYVQSDALGSPRAIIDPTRNLAIWRWDETKETFGDHAPNTDPDNDGTHVQFDLRFPGQRYDAASGLHYNYFRDYDPAVGRYTQSDPIGLAGGINTFAYAGGRPTGAIDPRGLYSNIVEFADAYGIDPELPAWSQSAAVGVAVVAVGAALVLAAPAIIVAASAAGVELGGFVSMFGVASGLGMFYSSRAGQINALTQEAVLVAAGVPSPTSASAGQSCPVVSAATKGRLGNQVTRDHIYDVATEMEKRGWTITGGGGRLREEYIPPIGGGRKGSSYPDITATKGGKTLRVNTVDTYADGITPTVREATNAARIRTQTGEHVLLIPKP